MPKKNRSVQKVRGGFEFHCVPVKLAREMTKGKMDDRMWFDRAEAKDRWVRIRRPQGDVRAPFEAVNLCDIGGDRGITLRRTRHREWVMVPPKKVSKRRKKR